FVTARPADPTGTVRVETPQCPPREYRGSIEVRPRAGTLLVINIVTVEEYLLGVVPAEMPSTYPIEALKAQAITARTFAVANRGKHARDGYDLCDTGNCQIYGGVSVEKPAAAEAVRATAGMIILYNGRPASVMYSSDCGGATQNPFETCPQRSLPYLCGVTEPADMPHTTWEAFVPLRDVESGLLRAGVKQAAGLASIRASKTDTSGRVTEFELTGSSGTAFVSGAKLRTALGAHVIKSLLLSVEQTTDGVVVFRGRGAGHGIGLCQVGAKWLASPPRNWTCDQILAHYFPGTQVAVPTRPADAASDSRNIGHAAETFPVTKRGREAKSSPSVLAKPDVRGGVDFDVRV
ncbi:MAG: SpoIID/LytB domain-containing protein, partial [Armatimonadota bacterium]